jgi:hypothetical protein
MEDYDEIKVFLQNNILTLGTPFIPNDEVLSSLQEIPPPTISTVVQRSKKKIL